MEDVTESSGSYSGLNVIKFIYPNHEIVNLYKNPVNMYWEELGDIKFSPDGEYISFILSVYDGHRTSVINTNTGNDIIFPDYDIKAFSLNQIIWSPDSKTIAIDNDFYSYGAEGSESVFIGNIENDYRLERIFGINYKESWTTAVTNLSFNENGENIYFSTVNGSGETKYKYNIVNKKLTAIL